MSVSKLVLSFATTDGETMTLAYNYIKSNVDTMAVQDLADGIVANGSIFAKVPVIAKSAKLITSTETDIELDS